MLACRYPPLDCGHQADREVFRVGVRLECAPVLHPAQAGLDEFFSCLEEVRENRPGLFVLVGELIRDRPESAAVGAVLEGVGLDEGVAPPDQAVVRVQASKPLGFPFDDLLPAQRDDRVHQRDLVG